MMPLQIDLQSVSGSWKPNDLRKGKRGGPDYSIPDEPNLIPIFGAKVWDATRTCADVHPNGPIPAGSRHKCEHCSETGIEGHPCLKPDALDRKGSRKWPDPHIDTTGRHQDGLSGGTGKKQEPKPGKITDRDLRWLDQHRGGLSIKVMTTQDSVSQMAVHEGIVRALFFEKAQQDAEAEAERRRATA